jgi:hypothetical protein
MCWTGGSPAYPDPQICPEPPPSPTCTQVHNKHASYMLDQLMCSGISPMWCSRCTCGWARVCRCSSCYRTETQNTYGQKCPQKRKRGRRAAILVAKVNLNSVAGSSKLAEGMIKHASFPFKLTPLPLLGPEAGTTFHLLLEGKRSFKLVWMESTSTYNSLIGHSLKRRCCSLADPYIFWHKPVLTL